MGHEDESAYFKRRGRARFPSPSLLVPEEMGRHPFLWIRNGGYDEAFGSASALGDEACGTVRITESNRRRNQTV